MLFVPPPVHELRRRLLAAIEKGEIIPVEAYRQMLNADPDDAIALIFLARESRAAGELTACDEYLWRAAAANPCFSRPYLELAGRHSGDPAWSDLGDGLAELGFRRLAHEKPERGLDLSNLRIEGEAMRNIAALPLAEQIGLLAKTLGEQRPQEPAGVTERLRYLRLALEVEQGEDLDRELVDSIIAAGEPMVPLLTGIVRAWARETLPDEFESALENAVALLGEIAPAEFVRDLLDLVDLEDEVAAGVSDWAIGRLLERDPEAWVRTVVPLIPSLDVDRRVAIMSCVHKSGLGRPAELVNQSLSDNFGSLKKADRDSFFPVFLMSSVAASGTRGLAFAGAALRQNAKLLSPKIRRECEELIMMMGEQELPPRPEAPEPITVYRICAGQHMWHDVDEGDFEDDEFEDDGDEDEQFTQPTAPVVRASRPGRNDPCRCGSGKKYKKCHLDADEKEERAGSGAALAPKLTGEFDSLRERIGDFLRRSVNRHEVKEAAEDFRDTGGDDQSDFDLALGDWLTHDWVPPGLGTSVMQAFLERHGRTLSATEREVTEAWARSFLGLYEVQSIERGKGVTLKDLLKEGTFFVHDVSLSKTLALWDCLVARVVPGERGTEVTGAGLMFPRDSVESLIEWLKRERRTLGLEWPAYLKANWLRIRGKVFTLAHEWRESLRLANTDGDELLFSKAVYEIEGQSPLAALEAHAELDKSGENQFVWLNAENKVLGNITLEGSRLIVDCNSKPRLVRARILVEQLLGGSLRHLSDEFQTMQQMKKRHESNPLPGPEADPIPEDVRREAEGRVLREHYGDWIDRNLPALGGKTPRAAVKTARGRREVAEILKSIQNGEERKRLQGLAFYDVSEIRAALGLEG